MRTWSKASTPRPTECEPMSRSGLRETPGRSSGTRKAVTPFAPPPAPVRAKSTVDWATMARLMPDFSPVMA